MDSRKNLGISDPGLDSIMVDLETLGTAANSIILTIAAVIFNPRTGEQGTTFYGRIHIDSYKPYKDKFIFDGNALAWWMGTEVKKPSPFGEPRTGSRTSTDALYPINPSPGEKARREAFGGERNDVRKTMENFREWIRKHQSFSSFKIWSHGSCFDIAILEYTFKIMGVEIPWSYRNVRDTRTLYDTAKIDLSSVLYTYDRNLYPDHHAMGDCFHQIEGVKVANEILFGVPPESPMKKIKAEK